MPAPDVLPADTLLYVDGVTVDFDGFKALNSLSLYLDKGELRTIIGPNGAGKTTMMDVITGKTRPTSGTVLYAGSVDLTRKAEEEIARLGIGRKFQKPTVFEALTVRDNLELASLGGQKLGTLLALRTKADTAERIDTVLETTGLTHRRDTVAGSLSHGEKQWLEIGMLLIQDPRLILLDEPVAGMTDADTEKTAQLILRLKGRHTVVVVEHDMHFVETLATKTTVLHEGRVLAEGSVAAVRADPTVVDVYLGRS
jgi:urea transport system ATP-binding protein